MEQYFNKEAVNCCKLDFSNKLAPTHKYILSPKKTILNPTPVIHKSAKKSLKTSHLPQTLTRSNDSRKSIQFQPAKQDLQKKLQQFNDYGQTPDNKNRTETKRLEVMKQIRNSAPNNKIKHVKSLDRKQTMHSPDKTNAIEDLRLYRFSQKSNLVRVEGQQQPRGSVFVKTPTNPLNTFRQQPVFTQNVPYFYRQQPNPYVQPNLFHQLPQHFYQVPTYTQSPNKYPVNNHCQTNAYLDQNKSAMPKTPLLKKQSSTNYSNYSENFKKIYGEVEIEDQIKHDLMVSLELHKKSDYQQDYGYHNDNGVSVLTKCPPSEQSTILPSDSKLRKKFQYQIDSFANHSNAGRKSCTQKYQKAESLLLKKPEHLRMNGRQKFKSIVSVQSEHSSSSGDVDSVIIDQHPQHLLSSNPIKSLL